MTKDSDTTYIQPKTTRGQQRVDLILQAAAALIVEEGMETLTTNAVAKRAQTSIGSLYQFFPNKESIVSALANQYRLGLQTILDEALEAASKSDHFSEQLDCIIDNVVQFDVDNLAFGAVFQPISGLPADSLVEEVMSRLVGLLSLWAPDMRDEDKYLHADICLRVMVALLPITHTGAEIRPQGVQELKNVLQSYLTPIL